MMTTSRHMGWLACLLLSFLFCLAPKTNAVTPPVTRSTSFNGAHSNVIHHALQPWMNTNTPNLTVEAWIYANDLDGHQAIVARNYTTNLYFGLNGNRLRFYRSGGTSVDSTGTLTVGRWTHVAVSYDGTTARFYINGTAAGSVALANRGNNSTNGLSIGGQRDQNLLGLYAFNGYLDEIRFWSVARSQSQIAANMNQELRSGTGLLAAFGSGGSPNDLTGQSGLTTGIPLSERRSGFGILPANLCVPSTSNPLRLDANIDTLNEYRGAETIVLRSTTSATAPDQLGYLMVSRNATNFHLYVGIPSLPQGGNSPAPAVQLMADANVNDGTSINLGDWECGMDQESFQGGRIFGVNPPFFPTPQWLSWGQSTSNWQAVTAGAFEFHQSYEFRIHGRHLNYFSNVVGLLVRYYDYPSTGDQLVAPRGGVTNLPATFARVDWCGTADTDLAPVNISGSVTNVSANAGVAGRSVSLYSGNSELGGYLLATTTTDASGRFSFNNVPAPIERRVTVTYSPPGGSLIYLDPLPENVSPSRPNPASINSPLSVAYPPCPAGCFYESVHFRYRVLGPVSISGATPASVPLPVLLRASPVKSTPSGAITVSGENFHNGVRLFFKDPGCGFDPPNLCTNPPAGRPSLFSQANILSVADDGLSLVAEVPTILEGVTGSGRGFQLVIENPSWPSTGGSRWNYGPSVLVTPPPFPQLYGFEFRNTDDSPSWEEFEACFGDNIFVDLPFTDVAVPGLRDPYYFAFYLPVYMSWMEIARGSCSGFASTSRMMANGVIPNAAYDRPDSGDGVHGVLFPAGYVAPTADNAPKPGRWTGFDVFRPFQPINIWGRIISLQGSQTSAEFLNNWLGQLRRPIATGPRRGISVGDPMHVLNSIRAGARNFIIVLSGREFQALHSVTPYAVIEEQGLGADVLTPEPRAGFSLIKIYDSNRLHEEHHIEIDRAQNTFRYHFSDDVIQEGAGLYCIPLSVFSNPRHALGPIDIAANLTSLLRVLHTGTAATTVQDGAGGVAGWSGTNFFSTYDGAVPFIPPGAVLGEPDRFDRTMFLLPATNPPASVNFVSGGSNVVMHYALGGGDFAFGFHTLNTNVSSSVYGILMPPTDSGPELKGVGVHAGAPVQGFSASVAGRDLSRRSLIWQIDSGAGTMTPDVHLERNGFTSLKIRNNSPDAFTYRVNLSGTEPQNAPAVFEFSADAITQPGNSTVVLKPMLGTNRGFTRELDTNNDGVPDATDTLPARGALRASKESGLLALRWRPITSGDTLETANELGNPGWSPANTTVTTDGADRLAKVPFSNNAQFYRVRASVSNCFTLAAQPPGAKPNPWTNGGFKFEALNAAGGMQPQNTIVNRSGATGLDVVHTLRIHPQADCDTMHLDIRQTSGYVIVEAIGPLGAIVGRQELIGAGTGLQRVTVRGFRSLIQYVRVISPNALCLVANICCERTPMPNPTPFSSCLSLSNATAGQFSSPYTVSDIVVTASPGPVVIGPVSGLGGNWLRLSGQVELKLMPPTAPCDRVTLRLRDFEGVVTATAYDVGGAVVATAGPPPGNAAPQELILSGTGIVRVVLVSSSDKAFLQDICYSRNGAP